MFNPQKLNPNVYLFATEILYLLSEIAAILFVDLMFDRFSLSILYFFTFYGPLLFGAIVLYLRLEGVRLHPLALIWHTALMIVCSFVNLQWLYMAASAV